MDFVALDLDFVASGFDFAAPGLEFVASGLEIGPCGLGRAAQGQASAMSAFAPAIAARVNPAAASCAPPPGESSRAGATTSLPPLARAQKRSRGTIARPGGAPAVLNRSDSAPGAVSVRLQFGESGADAGRVSTSLTVISASTAPPPRR